MYQHSIERNATHHKVLFLSVDGYRVGDEVRQVVSAERGDIAEVAAEEALEEGRLADAARSYHVTLEY